jgi:hypothetical protein
MECLFCHQEMEDEEKLVGYHVCPPEQTVTLNDVYSIMDEIVDSDEKDGWDAFIILRERLAEKAAQQKMHPTVTTGAAQEVESNIRNSG